MEDDRILSVYLTAACGLKARTSPMSSAVNTQAMRKRICPCGCFITASQRYDQRSFEFKKQKKKKKQNIHQNKMFSPTKVTNDELEKAFYAKIWIIHSTRRQEMQLSK